LQKVITMRVLIVVAQQTVMATYQLPLGIGYVSASLKRAGHNVRIFNPNHSRENPKTLFQKEIRDFCPDLIAAGGLAFHLTQIRRIAAIAHETAPHTPIVIGGALVSYQPEVAMQAVPEAAIGVIGEGEETIVDLVAALANGSRLELVPGLILRAGGGEFKRTMPRRFLEDLDALPWIDYEGLGLDIFAGLHRPGDAAPGLIVDDNARLMPFLTSRGCPFPCTFCCHEAAGRRYRSRSLDDVFAELESNIDRFGINTLFIYDDLFCLKRQRLEEFCERVGPLGLRWECSLRVEQINPQSLKMMSDSGCKCISFGIESMSPTVLASMKKKTTREALDQALNMMSEARITTWANLIFGDPAETWDTAMESMDWWVKNNRFDLRTAFIGYQPGSQIYADARQRGLIPDPLAFLLSDRAEINATSMSDEVYQQLQERVGQVTAIFGFSGRIVELTPIEGGYDLTTICPHCAVENHYHQVTLEKDYLTRLSCRTCNQLYRVPVIYRPVPTAELANLVNEINTLIWTDTDTQGNPDTPLIYATAIRALNIDQTQDQLWRLAIKIADGSGDPALGLKLLRQQTMANRFQPLLFDQMQARLSALGETQEAEMFARQAAQLRTAGILESTYYS
jgi:anaerobic magnesium-protoporphyrin IX monomethyl ester cyclase